MSLTRSDYLMLSAALASADPRGLENFEHRSFSARVAAIGQWENDCIQIAAAISTASPAFDRARFLEDCGVRGGA